MAKVQRNESRPNSKGAKADKVEARPNSMGKAVMVAMGAPKLHIDSEHVAAGSGRGWHILREHWRDFLDNRTAIPENVRQEMVPVDMAPQRATFLKESADRVAEKIIAHFDPNSPRSVEQMKKWKAAKERHVEVRLALAEHGWRPKDISPSAQLEDFAASRERLVHQPLAGRDFAASALFPTEWWKALSVELLSELVVDAFQSAFVDAFLDGGITILEVAEGWGAPAQPNQPKSLTHASSEPSLGRPNALRPLRRPFQTMPPHGDTKLVSKPASSSRGPSEGFMMSGLPQDPHEAWNLKRYHACQPLETFQRRIHKATEMQRPKRHIPRTLENPADLRKFSWPMTATNFPESWDQTTRRRERSMTTSRQDRGAAAHAAQQSEDDGKPSLCGIGKDGKTTFPYSLALHRAFLESQPDPILKEKAKALAPLRMTGSW